MKRNFLTLTLALLASLLLAFSVSAAEYGAIYTEAEALQSDELTELGKRGLPHFTAFYETDVRVDVLTGIGDFSSLADAAAAIYDEYDYGYGEGRNGVTLTLLVHEDEDGVVPDEWYLYAAGSNDALTTVGIQMAVDALRESMDVDDWAGDAEQDTQALVDAIATTTDSLVDFFYYGGDPDTIEPPESSSAEPEAPAIVPDSFPAAGQAIGYVTDTAGIMTYEERQSLEEAAQAVSEKHDFGVYLITVDSFRDFTDSYDVFDGATTLYNKYNLGLGEEHKGVLLLLSMNDRDFSLVTYSDYGNYVFDEATREGMTSYFLDNFQYDEWYAGFNDYIASCDMVLTDGPDKLSSEINALVGMIFLFPLIIAAIVIAILSRKMKSVFKATEAEAYAGGGLDITRSYDQFTHATETRKKRKEESSGGGGGGGTRSRSSGGFGGTSGKF
jgi:uncharacterized protein